MIPEREPAAGVSWQGFRRFRLGAADESQTVAPDIAPREMPLASLGWHHGTERFVPIAGRSVFLLAQFQAVPRAA
ncbi:hypothetical protein DWZ54_10835 [Mitsuokella sp. AF33-22]|nr:hypothetical protein DWX75_06870 [Mitsuokella sp. AF21-1AC]RHM53437.1 hypothetical protein DWZ54_10835 [Mitsuokella sp. AF33-22]